MASSRSSYCASTIQPSHNEIDNQPSEMEVNWENSNLPHEAQQPSPQPEQHQSSTSIQGHGNISKPATWKRLPKWSCRILMNEPFISFISVSGCLPVHDIETAEPLLFLDKHQTNVSERHETHLHKEKKKRNVWKPSRTSPSPLSGSTNTPNLCIARGAPAVELNVWRWGMRRACRMRRYWVARGAHK